MRRSSGRDSEERRGNKANISTQQAYDSHCNLVLGDVTETIYKVEEESDDEEASADIKVHSLPNIFQLQPSYPLPCSSNHTIRQFILSRVKQRDALLLPKNPHNQTHDHTLIFISPT